jgi:hypothetical protein
LACYKIAARWSDGATDELKTYGFACEQCVRHVLGVARRRQSRVQLAPEEVTPLAEVYDLQTVRQNREAARRPEIEPDNSIE